MASPLRLKSLVLIIAVIASPFSVCSFAYAPNFITKIVQEDTGIQPIFEQNQVLSPEIQQNSVGPSIKTRFPPEPNGYLHLGHAKAIFFNWELARMFGGSCNLRMDDTNPSKEEREYVNAIMEDVKWLLSDSSNNTETPWDGPVRKTSDYFNTIYQCAEILIQQGDAYVDSLSTEQMREYRGTLTQPGRDSPYRSRSMEENLQLFRGMRAGLYADGEHVLRAKIDMTSSNINMRDPTLYRIKHARHQETENSWCIYPMYDFSHPISDALEGITHSICTLEFEDHRPIYDWVLQRLLPSRIFSARPKQIEFSRLNMEYTVLSKRKLTQLVDQGCVAGWDDPRMPTLSGLRRRGIPPSAIRLFCERVGITKADSIIPYSVLEDCVRQEMDEHCERAFCVLKPLKITITNWERTSEEFSVPRHPKKVTTGDRTIPFGKEVYIERSDFFDLDGPEGEASGNTVPKGFKRLLPLGKVRLRYAYVIQCNEVIRDSETGEPIELRCTYFPETKAGVTPPGMARVRGIIHWVEATTAVQCKVNRFDKLFFAEDPGQRTDNFLQDLNPDSLKIIENSMVEPSVGTNAMTFLSSTRQLSIAKRSGALSPSSLAFQFERHGYFALDLDSAGMENLVFNQVVPLRDTWDSEPVHPRNNKDARNLHRPLSNSPPEDIQRIAFRAATIVQVMPHPDVDSLLVGSLDCGDSFDQLRTFVASIAGKVEQHDLLGKKVVAVTNLKPAKIRGIDSEAVLLTATNGKTGQEEVVDLLSVPGEVPNGTLLTVEGKDTIQPDVLLKSKGALKAFDRAKAALRTNNSGEVVWLDSNGNCFKLKTSAGAAMASKVPNGNVR